MIPEVALWLAMVSEQAWAQEPPPPEPAAPEEPGPEEPGPEDAAPTSDPTDLSPYRTSFEVLADRSIGTTSTAVEFNWRETKVQVGPTGSLLTELNNFNTLRAGALVRLPTNGSIVELGLTWAQVWDTPSSRLLAFTPYRQAGRPPRLELDVDVAIPLAEGVVTAAPRWFPAVQLVFNAYGGLRYSLYPTAFTGMTVGEVTTAVFSPQLTQTEIDNLEGPRLDAMKVDPGRYGLVAGFGNDLYFKRGFFVSPRVLVSVPLLAGASNTELLFWADLSMALGVAF